MKTTITSPLTFDIRYESLSYDLCLYEILVFNDSFDSLKKRYFGVAEKASIDNFISSPNKITLTAVTVSKFKTSNLLLISSDVIQELQEDQGWIELYLKQGKKVKELEESNVTYESVVKNIQSGKKQFVKVLQDNSSKNYGIVNLEDKALYIANYFSLFTEKNFFYYESPSNSLLIPEYQNVFNFPLSSNPNENKLNFLNKLIYIQKQSSVFITESFHDFLVQYTDDPKMTLLKGSLKKFKNKQPNLPDKTLTIKINDYSKYDYAYKVAQNILHISTEKYKPEIYQLINFILMQQSNIYKDLGIDVILFNKSVLGNTHPFNHTFDLLSHYVLSQELNQTLSEKSVVKKNKI